MPGLVAYSAAGLGLLLLAALESLPLPPFLLPTATSRLRLRSLAAGALSLVALLSSAASRHHLSLPSLAASALFLLYAASGLAPAPFPSRLLDLLLASAFGEELLLFAHRREGTAAGIENRYYDLLAAPILLCLLSTLLAAARPAALPPRLARAAGLALQGTWFLQMGFSFFTSAVAHGCQLHARARADYTIRCRTHEDYHRARALATLQFNGHLALLVLAAAAAAAAHAAVRGRRTSNGYVALGKEVQMEGLPTAPSRFTLDSDEEEGEPAAEAPLNGTEAHGEEAK